MNLCHNPDIRLNNHTNIEHRQKDIDEGDMADIVLMEGFRDLKPHVQRKMRILNKHLLRQDQSYEGTFQLPKVLPFDGMIPEEFIPYGSNSCYTSKDKGVYCHIDDYRFNSAWTHPESALKKIRRFGVAAAPDFTLWVDGAVCENVEQLRRSRTIQRFWQNNGVSVIQTASWADAESVRTFAFDGLAEGSWTAIGHQRIGNASEQKLFRYAVETLVDKIKPTGLLVFGVALDFDPGVPVVVKPSHISKLRKL